MVALARTLSNLGNLSVKGRNYRGSLYRDGPADFRDCTATDDLIDIRLKIFAMQVFRIYLAISVFSAESFANFILIASHPLAAAVRIVTTSILKTFFWQRYVADFSAFTCRIQKLSLSFERHQAN